MSNSINFHDDDIAKYECKPSKCQLFTRFFYNPQRKTCLGRSGSSWFKIGLFYLIYYCSLSAFFLSMLTVFLKGIIKEDVPARIGHESILKLSPGLSMRPVVDYSATLVKFIPYEQQSYMKYIVDLKAFLIPYEKLKDKPDSDFAQCTKDTKTPDEVMKICRLNMADLGPCTAENNFGYDTGKPCIFLKLNKIYGWIPDPINSNSSASVMCEGQNYIDKTNIGKVNYFPSNEDGKSGYFNHNFFPYLAQPSYVGPIVAIQFESAAKRRAILVKCEVSNVHYKSNILKFELMIDDIEKQT